MSKKRVKKLNKLLKISVAIIFVHGSIYVGDAFLKPNPIYMNTSDGQKVLTF